MGRPCPEVDEAHSCAFCQEHFALDGSLVEGFISLSESRFERMKRLLQVFSDKASDILNERKIANPRFELARKGYQVFDIGLDQLWSNAAEHCSLAHKMRSKLENRESGKGHHALRAEMYYGDTFDIDGPPRIFFYTIFIEQNVAQSIIQGRPRQATRQGYLEVGSLQMAIIAEEENVAAKDFPRRPMNHFPREHTQEHARGWLESCFHDRPVSQQVSGYIPKRLLAISTNRTGSSCVTVVTRSTPVPYATLSYMWGGTHEPRLTKARLKDLNGESLEFNVEALPKTIADAVVTTQALGISHLWVDALCIVQDDDADKAEQVGQMAKVYSRATVTIFASRSSSAAEGFLHHRDGRQRHKDAEHKPPSEWNFRLPYRTRDGKQGSIILTTPSGYENEPLNNRAWAFQEMLLSPHIIGYGTTRTVFDCMYTRAKDPFDRMKVKFSDDGNLQLLTTSYLRAELHDILYGAREDCRQRRPQLQAWADLGPREGVAVDNPVLLATRGNYHTLLTTWHTLLKMYSARKSSDPRDRLNAFSSVAELFSERFDDEYVAGFWRFDIFTLLLWRRQISTLVPRGPQSRPAVYCGPTWSWASILDPLSIPQLSGSLQWDHSLLVVDWQAKLVNDANKFGAVSSGHLKIRGKTVNATMMMTEGSMDPSIVIQWPTHVAPKGFSGWESLHDRYISDAQEEECIIGHAPIPVVVLILGFECAEYENRPRGNPPVNDPRYSTCLCLVLKRVSNSQYSRLGRLNVTEVFSKAEWPELKTWKYGLCVDAEVWDQIFPVETLTII